MRWPGASGHPPGVTALTPLVLWTGLWACGDGSDVPPPPLDDSATPAADTACAALPDVTWQGWGRGFFATYCDGCHTADAEDRRGAPEGTAFDTLDQVRSQADRIRARTLEGLDMPPGGGVVDDDLWLLDAFLVCGL